MPISQPGAINTTALYVPDVYVQIVPPSENFLNGVPTNILGIVGTAQWGPVNAPVTVGSLSDYAQKFGNICTHPHDMGTAVWAAVLNGANNFRCVRVTDGTDTAAHAVINDTPPGEARTRGNFKTAGEATACLTLRSKYTGMLGNATQVTLARGSKQGAWRVNIALPGLVPEVFDNIGAGLSGNAVWLEIANAINHGVSGLRDASQLVIASVGAGSAPPTAGTLTLAGGANGADEITGATLLGADTSSRTGLYALRGTSTSIAMLADGSDASTWSAQVAFGLSEGIYMMATGPAGDTIENALQTKENTGIDSTAMKLLFGDWVYFNDTVNGKVRLISPQSFVAGRLAGLSPEQSSLNKPLFGIVGTQKSLQNLTYSQAELQQLAQAGIDLITHPIPAGNSFGVRIGQNTRSHAVIHGDNYTRMTNYLASTLEQGMGLYIGKLQSPKTRHETLGTLNAFLSNLWQQGMIGDAAAPINSRSRFNWTGKTIRLSGWHRAICKSTAVSLISR